MLIHDLLQEAIDNALVLTIKYHGGSQPGTIRQISPISIYQDKVRARCLTSNAVKLFVIEKIEVCDNFDPHVNHKWDPTKLNEVRYRNLKSFLESNKSTLEDLGWYIISYDDSISLHRRFKNGQPLKSPDVSLYYEEYIYEYYIDLDGKEYKEAKNRRRPWIVRAKGYYVGSYINLDRAVDSFINQANLLSPNRK